ncbi:MAG: DUF928 domain-containing protein [Coleofasciculaceae cyanobacterium]
MIKLDFFLLFALLMLTNITTHYKPAQAQINSSQKDTSAPPKPPSRGTPDGREGSATRSPCEKTSTSLPFTPLLPVFDDGFSGLTLKEHPTFWFFIPYKTDSVSSGKFVIRDQGSNTIYRTEFTLPKTPGFVSITIPNTEKPLENNKSYKWTLVLDCANQNSDQPPDVSHEGLVQKVDSPTLENQLKNANLTQRIKLYIDNKVLYDAANDLANIRDIPDTWLMFLKSIELEKLKQEVIAGEVIKIEK